MFEDSTLQEQYDRLGYAVVDLLDPAAVDRVRAAWGGGDPGLRAYPFSATVMSPDPAYRREVHRRLLPELAGPLRQLVPGFELLYCMFNHKQATGPSSVVGLHQDWTLVDESRFGSTAVFCALGDLDETNGCLFVVDGTQDLHPGPRSMRYVLPYPELEPVFMEHSRPVPMRSGQACIHSLAVFHGSVPNVSGVPRLAVGALAVERNAALRHYVDGDGDDDRLEELAVDHEFFFDLVYGVRPRGGRSLGFVPKRPKHLTDAELRQHLARRQGHGLQPV